MEKNIFKDKKVIIFDLDGTIIDSIGIWNEVDKKLITFLGGVADEDVNNWRTEILHKQNHGNVYLNYTQALKERYNSNLSKEEILEKRRQIATDYLTNSVELKPNSEEALLILNKKGYTLALATATSKWNIDIYFSKNKNICSKIDASRTFKYIITKDDVSNQKPNPEIFLKCAEHFNVETSECLVVEDSLMGVQAGKNANMDVICMYDKYSERDMKEIKGIADVFVNNYNELIDLIK